MNERYLKVNQLHKDGKSLAKIAEETGFTRQWVRQILRKTGARDVRAKDIIHSDSLNLKFFNKIDSEESAYFLGLMYADGNIYLGSKNRKHYTVSINLAEEDIYLLEHLRDLLAPKHKLYFVPSKKDNQQNQWKLMFDNKVIAEQLTALGCGPRKSLILTFPNEEQVPSCLMRHFIRGYFDGDGCVSSYIRKDAVNSYVNYGISISSSNDFCVSLKLIMESFDLNPSITIKSDNGITSEMTMGGNRKVHTFLDWIYFDAKVYMTRKQSKYQDLHVSLSEVMCSV